MQQIDITAIADKLTVGQRSTIAQLDGENFVMLGCAEETARRLCKEGVRRPALVQRKRITDGPVFRLTTVGVMVKNELGRAAWEPAN